MTMPKVDYAAGRAEVVEQGVDYLHMAFMGFVSFFKVTGNELNAIVNTFALRVCLSLARTGADPQKIRVVLDILVEGYDDGIALLKERGELPFYQQHADVPKPDSEDFGEFYAGRPLPKMPKSKN